VLKRNDSSSKLSLNSSPDTKTTESLNNGLNKYSGSSFSSTVKTGSLIGDSSDIPLSQRLTGTYSPKFEAYLRDIEGKYGTMYMSEHVFGGDLNVYDPVAEAARISGTNFSSLEEAERAGGTAYNLFMDAYKPSYKLDDISCIVSFNQNGNWFKDGSEACKATALATLASINSGTLVTPDQVGADKNDGYLTAPKGTVEGYAGKTLNVTVVPNDNDVTPKQQLDKIKESLRKGNAIAVEVTTKKGNVHWVVVTGTVEGCSIEDISSINDLVGIDPWYGRCSLDDKGHLSITPNSSNTINLGDVNSKLGNSLGYGYMTVEEAK